VDEVHEYSIVQSLLDRVDAEARAHGATSVSRLNVSIGELAGVDGELLLTAFEQFRERTICTKAELCVYPVAAIWRCPDCDTEIPRGARLRCPDCDRPARLIAGDEIVLERIEMEVPHV
jgi:hydrogenase nickel incorporation protein HypA/HybF